MSVIVLTDKLYSVCLDNIGRFHEYPYNLPYRMDVEKTFETLRNMNHKSYAKRYDEDDDSEELPYVYEPNSIKINEFQLLKYLQCIEYQIEPYKMNFNERRSLSLLQEWIKNLMSGIVYNIPEYREAEWCELK